MRDWRAHMLCVRLVTNFFWNASVAGNVDVVKQMAGKGRLSKVLGLQVQYGQFTEGGFKFYGKNCDVGAGYFDGLLRMLPLTYPRRQRAS